jgi:hypothetical protein
VSDNKEYFKVKRGTEKNFGIIFSLFFLLVSLYLFLFDKNSWIITFLIAITFILISIFKPRIFFVPNILWFKFGMLLGRFVAPLVMGVIFFLIMMPVGFLLKIFSKENFNTKNNKVESYWIKRHKKVNTMKDQF